MKKKAPTKVLKRAAITGIGISVPSKAMSNYDLEKLVDTSHEWIVSRTGISERRIADDKTATSDLCYEASLRALEDAHASPQDIDLIIVCTVTPDRVVPSTACIVQERLGAKNAAAFDLAGGCTGFMYGIVVASQFVSTGVYRQVLVIGADTLSKITNWKDRETCILFGDGAGAVVISPAKSDKHGILDFILGADGSGAELLRVEAGGTRLPASIDTVRNDQHYIKMVGRPVFKFAVNVIINSVQTLLSRAKLKIEDIDCFIFHQANIRILENAAKQLEIPMEKVHTNVERYGNTSSASVPLVLEEARKKKKFKEGSKIILVGFGAGLTWGGALIAW